MLAYPDLMANRRTYQSKWAPPEVDHQSIHFRSMHPSAVQWEYSTPDRLQALISYKGIREHFFLKDEWELLSVNRRAERNQTRDIQVCAEAL